MKQTRFRQQLIDGTIRVIAREGMDKASAKQIELETGINVVYIYRCFKDKEDLFVKTFEALDEELLAQTLSNLPVMYDMTMPFEKRCRHFFDAMWSFFLSNRDKCLTFMRYFYSPYFTKYSAEDHQKRFVPVVEKFSDAFIDEADVWMILNHILNVMLDFAVKVHHGHMSGGDHNAEHVYRVIYVSVKQYFRNNERSDFPT